jgi:zinc/manganese transport system ATP-binding protein
VRQHFPEALLLARRPVAWGAAQKTLTPENLLRARQFHEAWDDDAPWCAPEEHDHSDAHAHDHSPAHGLAHQGPVKQPAQAANTGHRGAA